MVKKKRPQKPKQQDEPAKTRTWWHPLLAQVLRFLLGDAFGVAEEVAVGKLPNWIDMVITQHGRRRISALARRTKSGFLQRLNRFTLVEFKGPTDRLVRGDLGRFLAKALVWHSQQPRRISWKHLTCVILAPRLNAAVKADARTLGLTLKQDAPGIHRIGNAIFTMWLIETENTGDPVLLFVSRMLLRHRRGTMARLTAAGLGKLAFFVTQLVQQFQQRGEEFTMQHKDTEYMEDVTRGMMVELLNQLPPDDPLRRATYEAWLRDVPYEERLRDVPAEERLRGVSADDVVQAVPKEELARLRKLLETTT